MGIGFCRSLNISELAIPVFFFFWSISDCMLLGYISYRDVKIWCDIRIYLDPLIFKTLLVKFKQYKHAIQHLVKTCPSFLYPFAPFCTLHRSYVLSTHLLLNNHNISHLIWGFSLSGLLIFIFLFFSLLGKGYNRTNTR